MDDHVTVLVLCRDARSLWPDGPQILVDADHHIARLDHGVSRLSGGKLQFVGGFVGDRRSDDGAADVDFDMRGGRALFDLDDFALELISRAQLHGVSPFSCPGAKPKLVKILCPSADRTNRANCAAAGGAPVTTVSP